MKFMTLVPLTCALVAAWAPGASAATLSITVADEVSPPNEQIEVGYSGVADNNGGNRSFVSVSAVKDATSCGPSRDEHYRTHEGAVSARANPIDLPAGSFTGTTTLIYGKDLPAGRYQVCAYLTESGTGDPDVVAADSVTISVPKLAVKTFTSTYFGPPRSRRVGIFLTSVGIVHGSTSGENLNGAFSANMQVRIKPSLKRKHKLPSTIIMRGKYSGTGKKNWRARATRAVSKKLKRIKKLRATYRLRYTSPFRETVTRKVFLIRGDLEGDKDGGYVFLSSSGDRSSAAISGGPGTIGGGSNDGVGDCTGRDC